MTPTKAWIGVLAGVSFLAGLACGPLVTRWLVPPPPPARVAPFSEYQRALADRFELSTERRALLSDLLASYERELERIKDAHMADYTSAMEPELSAKGVEYAAYVRDRVLPPERRPEFDRLAAGLPIHKN